MEDVKAKAQAFLKERWESFKDAQDCGETTLAGIFKDEFLTLVEMYEAVFNEDVYYGNNGLKYEPKEA